MTLRREDCLDVNAMTPSPLEIGMTSGISFKELTVDDETDASHWVAIFPAGYSNAGAGRFSSGMDIYLLEGDLSIGSEQMVTAAYSYLPANTKVSSLSSQRGCRALILNAGPQRFEPIIGDEENAAATGQQTLNVRTWELPWRNPMEDIVKRSTWVDPDTGKEGRPAGVVTKILRQDEATGELVALTAQVSGFIDPGTEVHPHNESLYLVAGDAYVGLTYDRNRTDVKENLVLHKDFYISRYPGIWHGPVATQTGTLWLVHLSDGYTGIFGEVEDWKERVGDYFAAAAFR